MSEADGAMGLSVSFFCCGQARGNSGATYGGKTNQFFVKWLFLI